MEPTFSWLCPTPRDRERFLDMQDRLRFARVATIVLAPFVAATLVLSSKASWWAIFAALTVMTAIVLAGGWRVERRKRPELWVFFSTVVNIQVVLTLGAILSGGPRSLLVVMLSMPVVMVGARFSKRGLAVGAPVSALLIIAATVGVDPSYVAAYPESLAVPLAFVLTVAVYLARIVDSDVRHREDSTLDQLTGLLNRRGLERRFAEIAEQAALYRHPVSVVLADIDHFKRINDAYGHPVGDAVLRGLADAMRRNLRTSELLYRFGGEEFLLALPGARAADALEVAEKLRVVVEELAPEGLPVTCSFGVATAEDGEVVFERLLLAADTALYAAKRFGRNRVEQSAGPVPAFVS